MQREQAFPPPVAPFTRHCLESSQAREGGQSPFRGSWARPGTTGDRLRCRAVSIYLIPVVILGAILVLFATFAVLARVRGGRYLRPIVAWLAKLPVIGKG